MVREEDGRLGAGAEPVTFGEVWIDPESDSVFFAGAGVGWDGPWHPWRLPLAQVRRALQG